MDWNDPADPAGRLSDSLIDTNAMGGGPWISLVHLYLIFMNSPFLPVLYGRHSSTQPRVNALLGHLTTHSYWEVAQTIMSISRAQFSQVQ